MAMNRDQSRLAITAYHGIMPTRQAAKGAAAKGAKGAAAKGAKPKGKGAKPAADPKPDNKDRDLDGEMDQ